MECPEVQTFLTNDRTISSLKSGRIGEAEFKENVKSRLRTLGGVTGVSVVMPSTGQITSTSKTVDQVRDMLREDSDYYSVQHFDPSVIFSKEFLMNFVNSGDLIITTDRLGHYVQESVSLQDKQLHLSLIKRNHNLGRVEQHFHSKVTTKDGLHHLRMNLKDLDLKPRELESLAEAVSMSGLGVSLSWSHPDPSVCPSSLAKYLAQEGMEVSQTNCRVTSHVMSSVPVPTDWTEDQAEEVLHWVGGVTLGLSLQPPTAPVTVGSVSCVRSSGLHSVRSVTHLLTSAYSLLRARDQPWIAVLVHGPAHRLMFAGRDLVQVTNSSLSLLVTRAGHWTIKETSTRDFSHCKKSKYN